MRLSKKQKELDIIKWEKSVNQGYDACGSFEFCAECDKTLINPCDRAYRAYASKTCAEIIKSRHAKRAEKKAEIAATAEKMKNIYANKDRIQ